MKTIPLPDFARCAGLDWIVLPESCLITGVTIDSRKAGPGDLFVGIAGEKEDGSRYAEQALRQSAAAVLVNRSAFNGKELAGLQRAAQECGAALGLTDDTRYMLGQLSAAYFGSVRPAKVVAVTGSSGKTTTRGLIVTLLEGAYRVAATDGNLNNDLGVPLTLFTVNGDEDVLVVEMGMNHAGEIHRLAELVRPDIGVITNIGTAHLEFFFGREGIAAAKKELFDFFDEKCTAVLNSEDPFCGFLAEGVPGEKRYFSALPEGFEIKADLGVGGYRLLDRFHNGIVFPLGGGHNLTNLAAAVAVAGKVGLTESVISQQVAEAHSVGSRSRIHQGSCTVIDDSYNANPESMRSGLRLLSAGDGPRIAVLGDMLELGGSAPGLHAELGRWITAEQVCDELVAVGPLMKHCAEAAAAAGAGAPPAVQWFPDNEAAGNWLRQRLQGGETLLFKASRGMHLEELFSSLP